MPSPATFSSRTRLTRSSKTSARPRNRSLCTLEALRTRFVTTRSVAFTMSRSSRAELFAKNATACASCWIWRDGTKPELWRPWRASSRGCGRFRMPTERSAKERRDLPSNSGWSRWDRLSPVVCRLARGSHLLVAADPYFDTRRDRIIALTAQHRLPTIYQFREYAVAGGLLSYGVSITDAYRQYGVYAANILKGSKPADLPVQQVVKFELVINMKTAKALGVKISDNLLSLADEVIE